MRLVVRCVWLSTTVLLLACGDPVAAQPTPGQPAPVETQPPPAKQDPPKAKRDGKGKAFDAELAMLQRRLAVQIKRTEKVKGYSPWEFAGRTAMQIGRLSGDYADYKVAEDTIQKAFEAAKGPHGPFLLRAKLNYHLHRLDKIDPDIKPAFAHAAVGGNKAKAAIEVFVGKVAMQRGKFDEAQAHWDKADAMSKGSARLAKALWSFKTGDFATAEESYGHLARNYHGAEGEGAAWLDLIQAIMDLERGRYDEALSHLDDADADLSGYWLVDEHRAEITALKGDLKTAEAMYREIIERTNNPEFMDALASILRDTDRQDEAQEWINRATTRFEEQMALYPEAAYGHALGHFLDFGPPDRALDLARKNHAVRPNVDAKMLLAQAELGMGNVAAATAMIDAALATPWTTADLHYTAHEVYKAAGKDTEAAAQLEKALAINPHVAD